MDNKVQEKIRITVNNTACEIYKGASLMGAPFYIPPNTPQPHRNINVIKKHIR